MSGPKGGEYAVIENRRREEARRRSLLQELENAGRELRVAEQTAEAHARAGADVALGKFELSVIETDTMSIESAIRAVRQRTEEVRGASAAAMAEFDRTRMLNDLAEGVGPGAARTAAEAMIDWAAKPPRSTLDQADRQQAEDILATLDPDRLDAQDELLLLVGRLPDTSADTRRSIIEELRRRVRQLNREALRQREEIASARELELELMGVAGDAADELRGRLAAVVAGNEPFDPRLTDQVAEVVTARHAIEDRMYVAEALRESLSALGYSVGDEFVTSLGAEAVGYVERPGWSQHLLEVHLPSTSDRIVMAAVREGDQGAPASESSRTRDSEVEVEFCSTFAQLIKRLSEQGIRMDRIVRNQAGASPMNVVQPVRRTSRGQARTGVPLRSMESP